MTERSTEELVEALAAAYAAVTETVVGLDESGFARPTRTAAWTVKELLFHQSMDAMRALAAFASTTSTTPDVDAVTYWHPFRPSEGDGGSAHARFVQVSATAYRSGEGLVGFWRDLAEPAVRAARAADPATSVETQGHVIAVPDFVSTLLVEATIHHLDLTVSLPDAPAPPAAGLAETRRVLEGLAGGPLPSGWDDTTAALKGSGRVPLDEGEQVAGVPLLG